MSYHLEVIKDREYLNIELWGEISLRAAERVRDDVLVVLAANRCKRILVDLSRVIRIPTTINQYLIILDLRAKLPLDARVALLANEDFRNGAYFIEIECLNYGLNVKYFLEKREVVRWLCGKAEANSAFRILQDRNAYGERN